MAAVESFEVDQSVLPAAGTWALDTTHTDVSFTARHLMVTKVRGRFPVQSGTVTIAENPLESSVVAVIDVAGVHSGEAGRDDHLRNADFFEVDKYPTITFRSTKVEDVGGGEYKLTGDLTIKDVTRPVTLDLEYLGTVASPFGGHVPDSAPRPRSAARTGASRSTWPSKAAASSSATRSSSTSRPKPSSRSKSGADP